MRTLITLLVISFASFAVTPTLAAEPSDPVAAATGSLEARERAAKEELRTKLLATIETETAAQTAASVSCVQAKEMYIDAALALGRHNDVLALVLSSGDLSILAEFRKRTEAIKADAEAQIASAKAKASTSGAKLAEAQAKLAEAWAALEALNRVDGEVLDDALSSGIGGLLGSRSLSAPAPRPPATITLPQEFAACGFRTLQVPAVASAP